MTKNTGSELWRRAKKIIPGGNQLLSKRSEQFLPEYWPAYYRKAKGVEVWDLDENHYIDMSIMGIGACPLGYADPDVNNAVMVEIENGSMCTLNCPQDIELAETLIDLHPWAEMVRYARSGGEAMSIAVRIARASAKKDVIAFCGYHGWHDWYLAANLSDNKNLDGHLLPGLAPAGVPRALIGTSLPFQYNHLEELQKIADAHPESLAAIVMEPVRDHEPDPHFISGVQKIARENDAVLIVDEVSAGFRISTGGAHLRYSLKPDIAVFAKSIGNGYPMAAIIGTDTVMEAAQDTFVSSTNWTEGIGPVAALATIDKYRRCDVPRHLVASGLAIQQGWSQAAQESGLDIEVGGIPPLSHFAFQCDESLDAQTAFTQIMLKKGFLAGKSFYASYSHTNEHIESYLTATRDAFRIIAKHLEEGNLKSILDGPVAQPGFHRLT